MTQRGYIITGTDTDVGKTIVAAGIACALQADYWKPVQAGLDGGTDSETVARLSQGRGIRIHPEAYRLKTPCSPHEAARIDGCEIETAALALPQSSRPLVVEGAGGVLVPYRDDLLAADLFAHWGLPVILAARTSLGTISHSLLSIEALEARGIEVAGIVFVGDHEPVATSAIERISGCRSLGRLPWLDPLDAPTVAKAFAENIQTDLLA